MQSGGKETSWYREENGAGRRERLWEMQRNREHLTPSLSWFSEVSVVLDMFMGIFMAIQFLRVAWVCSLQSNESVWSEAPITTVACRLNVGHHAGSRLLVRLWGCRKSQRTGLKTLPLDFLEAEKLLDIIVTFPIYLFLWDHMISHLCYCLHIFVHFHTSFLQRLPETGLHMTRLLWRWFWPHFSMMLEV